MMYQNASTKCLTDRSLRLITSDVEDLVFRYVFPPEFFLGVFGNALNLWILSCHGMRNRANDMLAAVSFSDLLFFLFMSPHSLAVFKIFQQNQTFRYCYYMARQQLSALANWCSAAAIWFIFAVTMERFLVIHSPLRSKIYWKPSERFLIFALIFVVTGLLTMYHHFEYDCSLVYFCNNTQIYNYCYSAGTLHYPGSWDKQNITIIPAPLRRHYIRISTVCNAIFVVFVPIMAVGLLNMLLARRLQNHDKLVLQMENSNVQMIMAIQHKQKRRVTITVILISSCFALTQGPSAVMSFWELMIGYSSKDNTIFIFTSIANALVITGKTINFALFCLSSTHFRRKCALIFLRKFPSLSQTLFGRQISSRMSGKVEFRDSKALLMHRRSIKNIPHRSRNESKRFHAQLQPLAEASYISTEDVTTNKQSPPI